VPVPVARRERAADRASWQPETERRALPAAAEPAFSTAFESSGDIAFAGFDTLAESAPPAVVSQVRGAPRALGGVDWRRAIVLAEVLGCPVAMRDGPVFPGTPVGPS
jgi:hypothetical protein